ncbi:hypothetical protein NDU88_001249 [Pleurodeles waltl]|uniref:Uncharacterized protein n=1 Tax=Pleurodeles waltl TaxID=8319 RepID=A0AAV7MS77_PLEWA|nr:hypothetical protein NDU88_001249 [Pleurodeles waltl]
MGNTTMPSMLELKTLILEGNKAIREKIDGVATTVALMRQDLDKLRDKVKNLGIRVDGLEENVSAHTTQLTNHECRLQMQEAKLANLDDRSRCINVHTLGLQEGMETTPVEQFLETWQPTVLRASEGRKGYKWIEPTEHQESSPNRVPHRTCLSGSPFIWTMAH